MSWLFLATIGQLINAVVAFLDKYIVTDEKALPRPFVYAFYSCLLTGFWVVIYFIGFIPGLSTIGVPSFTNIESPTIQVIGMSFLAAYTFFMALGFVVLALASACIFLMGSASMLMWMALMFVSRFGASLVEVTTESYFFKQVKGHDSNLISLFRLTRPLGNLVGAIVGSLCLLFLPFEFMFIILGLIMASGAFITLRITDTK